MKTPSSFNPTALRWSVALLLVGMLSAASAVQAAPGASVRFARSAPIGGLFTDTDVEKTRTVDTVFAVKPGLRLELDNRYGDVSVATWERDEVRAEIVVRVRERDEERADNTMASVQLYQVYHGNFLRLETALTQESGGLKKLWQDLNVFDKVSLDVEYRLTVPSYTGLTIQNSFGDTYMQGITTAVSLDLSYGNLRMREVPMKSRIKLASGRAVLGNAPDLRLELKDAEVELREGGKLDLRSQSSDVRIERISEVILESKRDVVRIEQVGSLEGEAHFSDWTIENLLDRADLVWTLGRLDIEAISAYCTELRISQRNADVEINVEGLDFDLQAYLEGGKLIAPKELGKMDVDLLDVKHEIRTVAAIIGSGSSRIILKGDGGQVALFK